MKQETTCPECSGGGHDTEIRSQCCGAAIPQYPDYDLCMDCKDHTEPAVCERCEGARTVKSETQ